MPNRFNYAKGTDMQSALNTINQNFAKLDQEVTTKSFKDPTGDTMQIGNTTGDTFGMAATTGGKTAMTVGKYRKNRFAIIFYTNGIATELIGQAPDDGRMGHWVVPAGQDVISKLGG